MKTNYILIGVLITFILASPVSATWWDNDYAYKISLEINNTNGLTITDYQINVSIPFGINASSIRVVNETSATTIYHWCENVTNGGCYEVWFKAPHVQQGVWCNDTYAIYYGNDAVASTSDYDNTFTKTYNATGLVLELHMDEGSGNSVAVDSSGEGNDGTLTNMNVTGNATSGWQETDGGQWDNRNDVVFDTGDQLQFDGVNDYINCGIDSSFNITSAFTTSAWCFIPAGVDQIDWTSLIQKDIAADGQLLYGIRFTNYGTNTIGTVLYNGTTYKTSNGAGNIGYPLSTGMWHHVAGVYDGNTIFLYVDGIDREHYVAGVQTIPTTTFPVTIGKQKCELNRFINSSLDEVRIYNRALSEEEIYRQYIRSKYAPNAPITESITEQMIITKPLPLEQDVKAIQTLINMCSGIKLQLTILFDNAVNILPLIIAIAFMGIFSILIGKIFSTGLRIKK